MRLANLRAPPTVTAHMRHDIDSRGDIDALMVHFYERVMTDETIGYIFTDIAKMDLEEHLPVIGDFWESMLFGSDTYRKHGRNPLMVHARLDQAEPLQSAHFERWLTIFTASVDALFAGPRAEFIKIRSRAIAQRMLGFIEARNAALARE